MQFSKKIVKYVKFLALNTAGVIIAQVLLHLFKTPSALVVAAVPIILSGWFFGCRYVWIAAVFSVTSNGICFDIMNLKEFSDNRALAFGIISHSIYASTGFALCFVRKLYTRINTLNEEVKCKNIELQAAVFRDPLTNLHNRRYVNEVVVEKISVFLQAVTTPEFSMRNLDIENNVMFLMIADIDHFKKINDTYGHTIGDHVLAQVSKRIRDAVRFDDTVVRWGGEEFLIICPMMKKDAAELVMKKVLDGVRSTCINLPDGKEFWVTVSIGAIWVPFIPLFPHAVSFESAIVMADNALYDAKNNNRNHGRLVTFRDHVTLQNKIARFDSADELYRNSDFCEIRIVGMD